MLYGFNLVAGRSGVGRNSWVVVWLVGGKMTRFWSGVDLVKEVGRALVEPQERSEVVKAGRKSCQRSLGEDGGSHVTFLEWEEGKELPRTLQLVVDASCFAIQLWWEVLPWVFVVLPMNKSQGSEGTKVRVDDADVSRLGSSVGMEREPLCVEGLDRTAWLEKPRSQTMGFRRRLFAEFWGAEEIMFGGVGLAEAKEGCRAPDSGPSTDVCLLEEASKYSSLVLTSCWGRVSAIWWQRKGVDSRSVVVALGGRGGEWTGSRSFSLDEEGESWVSGGRGRGSGVVEVQLFSTILPLLGNAN
ncbi:hypothetical protein CK203_107346 [Vitis vinifera]|uniref:DUF4283 domain-containing protein n=1 Tax=Vitis vinifera TaxID=29760 RepID=A0A438CDJ7_VITVI|nr:hypothetical protein CK203_107346 [Vitis vinifera]